MCSTLQDALGKPASAWNLHPCLRWQAGPSACCDTVGWVARAVQHPRPSSLWRAGGSASRQASHPSTRLPGEGSSRRSVGATRAVGAATEGASEVATFWLAPTHFRGRSTGTFQLPPGANTDCSTGLEYDSFVTPGSFSLGSSVRQAGPCLLGRSPSCFRGCCLKQSTGQLSHHGVSSMERRKIKGGRFVPLLPDTVTGP